MGKAQVVITRRHKKLGKIRHGVLFMLTGGASAPFTAVQAARIGSYNATTRKLAAGRENYITAQVRRSQ